MLGDGVDVEDARDRQQVDGRADQAAGKRKADHDQPPAGLEDAQGAGRVVLGDEHRHLVQGEGAEAEV